MSPSRPECSAPPETGVGRRPGRVTPRPVCEVDGSISPVCAHIFPPAEIVSQIADLGVVQASEHTVDM